MKIEIDYALIEKAIEQLELAQKDKFAYETDFLINDLKSQIKLESIDRNLLLKFYKHLCENEPLPINTYSMEREVDRFIKNNNEKK